jgi:hypothetical protein
MNKYMRFGGRCVSEQRGPVRLRSASAVNRHEIRCNEQREQLQQCQQLR